MTAGEDRKPRVRPLGALGGELHQSTAGTPWFQRGRHHYPMVRYRGPASRRSAEPLRLQWPQRAPHEGLDAPREPATLIVRVDHGFAIDLQHMAPQVIDRINGYLGWRCVGRLALRQAPLHGSRKPKRRPAPLDPRHVRRAQEATEGIDEPDLRRALVRLGARVFARRRPTGA